MKLSRFVFGSAIAVVTIVSDMAIGGPITLPIQNSSFETPAVPGPGHFETAIDNWVQFGFSGVIGFQAADYTNTDGAQWYTLPNNSGIFQDVDSSFIDDFGYYKFTVGLANESGHPANSTDNIELKIEEIGVGPITVALIPVTSLSTTEFRFFSVQTPMMHSLAAIRATVAHPNLVGGPEYAVDNVALQFAPEPVASVLFGLGGLALLPLTRKRRCR